ncbi:DUF3592 domain-containing protein [Streptomyces sp. NPDC004609]|uniref:DUF3592 domain-containing protein n=1 Tax=Streptomyces sp. NPDC004609 TaxID=3364704 RepID=UPI0036A467CE
MSTVDPAAERRRGEQGASGSGRAGFGAIVGPGLYAAAWWLFGFGLADAMAYPVGTAYLTADTQPANDTPGFLWALFTGVVVGPLMGVGLRAGTVGRLGLRVQSAISSAVATSSAALGLFLGARSLWVAAPGPGTFVDATGQRGAPWGAGAWGAWTSQYWVPALLALFVVLRIAFAVRADRAEGRRAARARAVVETGVRAPGVVTEAAGTGVEIGNMPRIRFVVRFTDHEGTDRWVTRTGLFDRTRVPRAGDDAVVWFDPADPGDENSIPVVLGTLAEVDAGDVTGGGDRTIH